MAGERRGVVLFGPEFGSNRWSCTVYCGHLLAEGYDLFTFDFRCQGESESHPRYQPLMWVTDHEERDMKAAINYLQARADADRRGIGVFGVSRGGGAALLAASKSPYVRCVVTDGAFATRSTMIPYMRKWIDLYCSGWRLQRFLPDWFFGLTAHVCLWFMTRRRGCRFPSLQRAVARLAPRPLLMIHGAEDTYIKPEMAQRLFQVAGEPKELWLVPSAKHNLAVQIAADEYQRRIAAFLDKHLAGGASESRRCRDAETEAVVENAAT
jgi:alpha-beta hydrolase superfamily lysophospholipase